MTGYSEYDPKGLIREAYNIDGITPQECRSIFLDWALSLPLSAEVKTAISALLSIHHHHPQTHPMTQILRDGLQAPSGGFQEDYPTVGMAQQDMVAEHTPRGRRGGRKARLGRSAAAKNITE